MVEHYIIIPLLTCCNIALAKGRVLAVSAEGIKVLQ